MTDISKYIKEIKVTDINIISLSGMLEFISENYFVENDTYQIGFNWITVYYNPQINYIRDLQNPKKEDIIAYVSSNYQIAFVLDKYVGAFKQDTKAYNMKYISVNSFNDKILFCSDTALFSDIVWIDDDFMTNENISFDFESFYLIDDGIKYINPKHFSVIDFIDYK